MKKKEGISAEKRIRLERYFEDLKKLFLRRFDAFEAMRKADIHDAKRLEELLKEIVYVKSILDGKEV